MKTKVLTFLLIVILSTPAWAAWKYNVFTGKQDYYEAGTAVTAYEVADLAALSPSDGDIVVVTDGADAADCTVGGGTTGSITRFCSRS